MSYEHIIGTAGALLLALVAFFLKRIVTQFDEAVKRMEVQHTELIAMKLSTSSMSAHVDQHGKDLHVLKDRADRHGKRIGSLEMKHGYDSG